MKLKKVFIFGVRMHITERATDALLLCVFWHALSNVPSIMVQKCFNFLIDDLSNDNRFQYPERRLSVSELKKK